MFCGADKLYWKAKILQSGSLIQHLLLHSVSRWQKQPLELPAAGSTAGRSGLPALAAELQDNRREKWFVLKFRETSALYQFDLIVDLTFFSVLIQNSVHKFCISCSQTADDLLLLHYYSWFRQPASLGAEEECWWYVCVGYTAGTWLVTDSERKGLELSVWLQYGR